MTHPFRLALAVLLAAAGPALAHTAGGETGGEAAGLLSGLSHPASGWDHVLAMVAVGLWGAQLGAPAVWVLPVAFPVVMALGGVVGLLGIGLPGVEVAIALSALVLGAMVLFEVRPPLPVAAALVAAFAIFHGRAHGAALPDGADGLAYGLGFVVATGLLHALGIAVGLAHRWPAGRLALRGAGAVVAAAGPVFLWNALA